jgi:hypothetical protein
MIGRGIFKRVLSIAALARKRRAVHDLGARDHVAGSMFLSDATIGILRMRFAVDEYSALS